MILIHDLYLEYMKYSDNSSSAKPPSNVVWMKDTVQKSLVMCMPQDRNIHNNIFGGYLMKLAFELAYSAGLIFAKNRIYFTALDDITFRRPVSIGSLLSLRAEVVYSAGTPSKSFQVKVRADVLDPLTGDSNLSNEFYFTFYSPEVPLKRVIPRSYDERFVISN